MLRAFSKIWIPIILIIIFVGGILAWQYFKAPEEEASVIEKMQIGIFSLRCKDGDGGLNYYQPGSITFLNRTFQDRCVDNNYLIEGHCQKWRQGIAISRFERHFCKNGCNNGACNISVSTSTFTTTFVLLVKDQSEATAARLDKLGKIRNYLQDDFFEATRKLARMEVDSKIYIINTDGISLDDQNNFDVAEVTKKFYRIAEDRYDFIALFTTPSLRSNFPPSYIGVKNDIHGIGEPIYDNTNVFGSKGKLQGVALWGNPTFDEIPEDWGYEGALRTGSLLHEFGHRWACYVGDNFTGDLNNNAKLEIKQEGIHFYLGLEYPISETQTGSNWIPNNDGTYRSYYWVPDSSEGGHYDQSLEKYPDELRYHPFQLYFMGLLPKEEYGTKFKIYNAGIFGPDFDPIKANKATFYKEVSVYDIIEIAGERYVETSF